MAGSDLPPTTYRKCFICNNKFKSPRVLPCMHVFCEDCLVKHWRLDGNYDSGHSTGSSSGLSGKSTKAQCGSTIAPSSSEQPSATTQDRSKLHLQYRTIAHDDIVQAAGARDEQENNTSTYCEADPLSPDDSIDAYAVSSPVFVNRIKDCDELSEISTDSGIPGDQQNTKPKKSWSLMDSIARVTDKFTKDKKSCTKRVPISPPTLVGPLPDRYGKLPPAGCAKFNAEENLVPDNDTTCPQYIPMGCANANSSLFDATTSPRAVESDKLSNSLSQEDSKEVNKPLTRSLTAPPSTRARAVNPIERDRSHSEENKTPEDLDDQTKRSSFLYRESELIRSIQTSQTYEVPPVTSEPVNRPLPALPNEYDRPFLHHEYAEPNELGSTGGYLDPVQNTPSQREPLPELPGRQMPSIVSRTFDHTRANNRKLHELVDSRHVKSSASMLEETSGYEPVNSTLEGCQENKSALEESPYSVPRDLERQWREQNPSGLRHPTMFVDPNEVKCPICAALFKLPKQHSVSSLPKCSYVEQITNEGQRENVRSQIRRMHSDKEVCHVHSDRNADTFCATCFHWLCEQCRQVNHKRHDILTRKNIQERDEYFIRSYSKKTNQIRETYENQNRSLFDQSQKNEQEKNQQLNILVTSFEKLNKALFEAYRNYQQRLENYYDTEGARLEDLMEGNNRVIQTLQDVQNLSTFVCKTDSPHNINELSKQITNNLIFMSQREPLNTDRKNLYKFQAPDAYPSEESLQKLLGSIDLSTEIRPRDSDSTCIPVMPHRKPDVKVTPIKCSSFSVKLDTDEKGCIAHGIAVNQRGEIMIADDHNRKVKIFSSNGQLISETTASFIGPWDIASINDTLFAVSDNKAKCLLLLDYAGNVQNKIEALGSTWGVCYCTKRGLYVSDPENKTVWVLNEQGEVKHRFNTPLDCLKYPQCVAIDRAVKGDLVVSDFEDQCLHIFNSTGQYLTRVKPRLFTEPSIYVGLLYRQSGDILAVDVEHRCIIQFDRNGVYLSTLLTQDHGLDKPQTIAISREGYLLVLDGSDVKAFDIGEPKPITLKTKTAFHKPLEYYVNSPDVARPKEAFSRSKVSKETVNEKATEINDTVKLNMRKCVQTKDSQNVAVPHVENISKNATQHSPDNSGRTSPQNNPNPSPNNNGDANPTNTKRTIPAASKRLSAKMIQKPTSTKAAHMNVKDGKSKSLSPRKGYKTSNMRDKIPVHTKSRNPSKSPRVPRTSQITVPSANIGDVNKSPTATISVKEIKQKLFEACKNDNQKSPNVLRTKPVIPFKPDPTLMALRQESKREANKSKTTSETTGKSTFGQKKTSKFYV